MALVKKTAIQSDGGKARVRIAKLRFRAFGPALQQPLMGRYSGRLFEGFGEVARGKIALAGKVENGRVDTGIGLNKFRDAPHLPGSEHGSPLTRWNVAVAVKRNHVLAEREGP